ncbi:MAG: hypothetical protein ACMG6S_33825, partial [Byssovorax sp.]
GNGNGNGNYHAKWDLHPTEFKLRTSAAWSRRPLPRRYVDSPSASEPSASEHREDAAPVPSLSVQARDDALLVPSLSL